MKIHSHLRALASPLFCALLALPLIAGPAGKTGLGIGGAGSGNDDIGSLPSTLEEDPPSLLLIGTIADVADALISLSGPGAIYLHPLDPWGERVALELEGSLHVQLDAEALAAGHVTVWFDSGTTFADSLGVNQLREISPSALARGASMTAWNRAGQAFSLGARLNGDVLHVRQILR